MENDLTSVLCTNSTCNYAETGQCVEGNTIGECTFLVETHDENQENSPKPLLPSEPKVDLIDVGGEGHLSIARASTLLKKEYAPLIAFLGAVDAGKTSLIAEVYDAFQYDQYNSLEFAGSQTLMAFEQISHAVRAASRAERPTPERTELTDDPSVFELRVAYANGKKSILLADRSGETYRQITDKPELSHSCLELARADVINVLVDGEKLCDPTARNGVMSQCTQALQTLVLADALPADVSIVLVLTKLDAVDVSNNKDRVHADFDGLPARIYRQCGKTDISIKTFKIAACPQGTNYVKGYGVEELLKYWLNVEPSASPFVPSVLTPQRSMDLTPSSVECYD